MSGQEQEKKSDLEENQSGPLAAREEVLRNFLNRGNGDKQSSTSSPASTNSEKLSKQEKEPEDPFVTLVSKYLHVDLSSQDNPENKVMSGAANAAQIKRSKSQLHMKSVPSQPATEPSFHLTLTECELLQRASTIAQTRRLRRRNSARADQPILISRRNSDADCKELPYAESTSTVQLRRSRRSSHRTSTFSQIGERSDSQNGPSPEPFVKMLSHIGRPVEAEKLKLLLLNTNCAETVSLLQHNMMEGVVSQIQSTDAARGVLSPLVNQFFIENINKQHPIRSERYSCPL